MFYFLQITDKSEKGNTLVCIIPTVIIVNKIIYQR